jgi:hypothetical protein
LNQELDLDLGVSRTATIVTRKISITPFRRFISRQTGYFRTRSTERQARPTGLTR